MLAQWGRRSKGMLTHQLHRPTAERALSTEPFIDHDAQRILITRRARFALQLFGCHIGQRTSSLARYLRASALFHQYQSEVTEQNLVVYPQQHVFRLDIAVNKPPLVRV